MHAAAVADGRGIGAPGSSLSGESNPAPRTAVRPFSYSAAVGDGRGRNDNGATDGWGTNGIKTRVHRNEVDRACLRL